MEKLRKRQRRAASGSGKSRVFQLRIQEDIREKLEESATNEGLSLAAYIVKYAARAATRTRRKLGSGA